MSVLSLFCFVGNGWKWCIMKRTCAGRGVYDCGWPADFAVHLASFSAWRVDIGRDHVPQPQQDLPHCQSNNLNSSTPSFPSFPHFSIFQPNTQQTQSRINPARRGTSWYVVSHRVTPSRPFLPIYKFFQKVTADQLRNVTRIRKIPDNKFIDEADWDQARLNPPSQKQKWKSDKENFEHVRKTGFSPNLSMKDETVQWDKPRVRQQSDLYNIMVAAWRVIQ